MSDGCAPASGFGRGVCEVFYEGCAREDAAHHFALHADALAVYDADAAKASLSGLFQICFDHLFDIARRDGVQVKDISYLYLNRVWKRVEGVSSVGLCLRGMLLWLVARGFVA